MKYARLINELYAAGDEKAVRNFVHQHRSRLDDGFLEALRRAAFGADLEGPFDDDKIRCLINVLTALGIYEFDKNNFLHACAFYEDAAALAATCDDPTVRGFILHDWGLSSFHLGKYEDAVKIWEEAVSIFKQAGLITASQPELLVEGTGRKISWIEMLRYIGTAYEAMGQPEMTILSWQQAMQLSQAAGLEDHQGWIVTDFGNLYRKLWRFEEALPYDHRALEFHQQQGHRAEEGFTLNNLGLIYSFMGAAKEAIAFYQKALEIANALKNFQEKRNRLGNLARVLAVSGQKEKALKLFRCARLIKTHNKAQDEEALVLINTSIGNVYRELGLLEKALKSYTEALQLARTTKNGRMENRLLSSLGIVYRDLGNLELAHTHFLASRTIAETAKDELGREDAVGNLGNILYQKGRVAEAEPYYREALEIARNLNDILFISRWLGNLANAYSILGHQYATQAPQLSNQAEAWYNQALALARDSNDLDHVYLWNYNLGSLYRRARRQLPKAFEYYENAITALETLRRAIKRDDFSRSYGESKVFVYQDMVNTCLQIKSRREQAIDFVERGKGYTLMRIMDEANLRPSVKVPESLRNEFMSLRENQFLGEAPHLNPTSPEDRIAPKPPEYQQKSQAGLKKNYEDLTKSLHSIARYEPEFADVFQPQRLRLDDIKEHLSQYHKKTALVEFFVTDEQTNVFIGDSKEWHVVTLPQFTERDLRQFLDENWLNPYRQLREVGKKLFASIWQAVQDRLDQIKPARLVLVPHLGLHLLPLHLIPCSSNKEEPEYLSDRYEIAYTPSFRMQVYCRNEDRTSRLQNSLFAVSNPDRSLEFAEIETTSISRLFDEVCVSHHETATRQAIFDNADRYNLIHFSTHGRGATLGNPLEAGLKMESNKFLTVKEIFKELHLPESYAVVLSACETGMVQLDLGDEYIGLPAAFLYAGAPAVVSSLWSVEDISTALLIHRWYELVLRDKMGRCAALMAAQKWLRNLAVDDIITELQKMVKYVDEKIKTAKSENETEIFASQQKTIAETLKCYAALSAAYCPFDDPYYWGGFIVSGNPE